MTPSRSMGATLLEAYNTAQSLHGGEFEALLRPWCDLLRATMHREGLSPTPALAYFLATYEHALAPGEDLMLAAAAVRVARDA